MKSKATFKRAAAEWARKVLAMKNPLTARDAQLVEAAFAFRMPAFEEKSRQVARRPALSRRNPWRPRRRNVLGSLCPIAGADTSLCCREFDFAQGHTNRSF